MSDPAQAEGVGLRDIVQRAVGTLGAVAVAVGVLHGDKIVLCEGFGGVRAKMFTVAGQSGDFSAERVGGTRLSHALEAYAMEFEHRSSPSRPRSSPASEPSRRRAAMPTLSAEDLAVYAGNYLVAGVQPIHVEVGGEGVLAAGARGSPRSPWFPREATASPSRVSRTCPSSSGMAGSAAVGA